MRAPAAVLEVLALLEPAYLVGGCVRDLILGREPQDWDIATALRPAAIKERAAAQGWTVYAVGEKFGTIGIHLPEGLVVEATTFRGESYDGVGRKPDVAFTDNLLDDLGRRDFTFNAMAMSLGGAIIDPFGGRQALERREVRFVGDPYARVAEDPLRILRAARFASRFGFTIFEPDVHTMQRCVAEVRRLSGERIRDELVKILYGPDPVNGLTWLKDIGVLRAVLPELDALSDTRQDRNRHHVHNVWDHTLAAVAAAPAQVRLAALFHDVGKPATWQRLPDNDTFHGHDETGEALWRQVAGRLRFSNDDTDRVAKLVRHHLEPCRFIEHESDRAVRRLLRTFGDLEDLIALGEADAKAHHPDSAAVSLDSCTRFRAAAQRLASSVPRGSLLAKGCGLAVIHAFNVEGPAVRELLQRVEAAVLDGELAAPVEPEQAVAYLKR